MAVLRYGKIVMVADGAQGCVIEPARFQLDLSCVEMVDRHLSLLSEAGTHSGVLVDALLDARQEFSFVESHPELVEATQS